MVTKQTEALKMAYDWLNEYAPPEVVQACKEALEQPSWQRLSDEEIESVWIKVVKYGISSVDFTTRYARAIEQASKEKNT